jgi:phosphatidate cytidylyltransferase
MKQRVITTIILALILVPAVLLGGWPYRIVIGLITLVAANEIIKMAEIETPVIPAIITYLGTLSVVYHDWLSGFIPAHLTVVILPLLAILLLLICTVMVRGYNFTSAGISVLTMFYIGLGGYAAIRIRTADLALFIFILLVVYMTDTSAYFIGSKFGKNKLAPLLSPNKTIEGFLGGIISSFILAAIYLNFFTFKYSYGTMLIMAIILSVTGQFGDLLESSLKRHFKVKDSGSILPGHGGILDRFDSTLFTLSVAFLLGVV